MISLNHHSITTLSDPPPPVNPPCDPPGWQWDWDKKSFSGEGKWYYRPGWYNGNLDAATKARAVLGEEKFAKQEDVRRYLKKTLWRKYEPTELSQQVI